MFNFDRAKKTCFTMRTLYPGSHNVFQHTLIPIRTPAGFCATTYF